MISREFLINLSITGLAGLLIFLYFKNRMSRVEQKMDLMFQLIQEYEHAKANQQHISSSVGMSVSRTQDIGENAPTSDLISVSDDDESVGESSDSEEVSDDEATLQIQPETISLSNKEVRSINLAGAETDLTVLQEANADDLADISSIDGDITLEEVIEPVSIEQSMETKTPSTIEESVQDDESVKKINLADDVQTKMIKPLKQHTVASLKQICKDRGFTNYNALRKGKLIQLLESSP